MKTNLGLETTDEERLQIGLALGLKRMVTRKELREEVERHVEELKRGIKAPERERDEETVPAPTDKSDTRPADGVCGFVPSRGDEPYLYKPQDPELAAVCSNVLDVLERFEKAVWRALEENRA